MAWLLAYFELIEKYSSYFLKLNPKTVGPIEYSMRNKVIQRS